MADYEPFYAGGANTWTATVGATAVVGGQLLTTGAADNTVIPATTIAQVVVGVAAHDAGIGMRVTVWPLRGVVHELVADAAIALGAVLGPPATTAGRVLTFATPTPQGFVGIALMAAAGAASKLRVAC